MSAELAEFELYKTYETMMNKSRLLTAVCLGVAVWDWLTTFNLEYRYIWKRRPTIMDLAFFVVRYGVMVQLAVVEYLLYWPKSPEACGKIFRFEFLYPPFMYLTGSYILSMRVYAIWGKNKFVLGGLIALIIAQAAVQFWNPQSNHRIELPNGVHACIAGGAKHYWLFYVCPLIFDLVVLFLTLFKTVNNWRKGARSTLMAVIARDSILFYALALVANCANIINYALTPPEDNRILLCSFACALQGISVCRIVLNVHTAASASSVKSLSLPSNIVHGISLNTFKRQDPNVSMVTATQGSASQHVASRLDEKPAHTTVDEFPEKEEIDNEKDTTTISGDSVHPTHPYSQV